MKRQIVLTLLMGAAISYAQAPQIPLTGNVGAGGAFPTINSPAVVFATDANHTMAFPETSGSSGVIVVTSTVSLTATRSLIVPLTTGFNWQVQNATTGGQSIVVIGATGTGVTIPNGTTANVHADGTNVTSVTATTGISVTGPCPAGGTGSCAIGTPGTAATPAAGKDILNDVTGHGWQQSVNGSALSSICTAANIGTSECPGGGGGGGLPTATSGGQIYTSTAAGTTAAVQPQIFYSQPGDTIASVETECSSACTYVVTAPQTFTLAADHAMNGNVQLLFQAGGQWAVNGAFTLSNIKVEQASSLTQHFAGTSTLAADVTVSLAPLEWFGGIGDGVLTGGGSGTDNAPAFAKCIAFLTAGQCVIQPKVYLTHSTISITKSSVGIRGMQYGLGTYGGSTSATIAINSATADIIDVAGADQTHWIYWNNFNNFALFRTVFPTGTGKGFSSNHTCGVVVDQVTSNDSVSPFYAHDSPACTVGGFMHTQAAWGFGPIPISSYTAGSFYGYNLDSEDGVGESSIYVSYSGFAQPGFMAGATSYGAYIHGQAINDENFYQFGGNFTTYGAYVTYDGGGGAGTGGDIHFTQSVFDTSIDNGIYIENIPFSAGWDGINFDGGLLSSDNRAIDVENTSVPIVVSHAQIYSADTVANGTILLNNTSHFTLGDDIVLGGGPGIPPYLLQLTNSSNNTITGNQFIGPATYVPTTMISLTGTSVNNNFAGNAYSGYAVTGISINSTSQNNNFGPNVIDSTNITTPYSGFTTQATSFPNLITCGGSSCGYDIPSIGLIESWGSQEGQGTILANAGFDYTNDATATAVTWTTVSGFPGKVATYNGTSSSSVAASAAATNFTGSTPFSTCAWVAPTNPAGVQQDIVSNIGPGPAFKGWEIAIGTSQIFFGVISDNAASDWVYAATAGGVVDTSVQLLCATYNANGTNAGIRFYRNGVFVPTSSPIGATLTGSAANGLPVTIGTANSHFFSGAIGGVKIWKVLLSDRQILDLYKLGPGLQ